MDRDATIFVGLARGLIVIAACSHFAAAQSRPAAESRPVAPESQPAGDPDVYAPLLRYCPEKIESMMLFSAAGLPEDLKMLAVVNGDFQQEATFKAVRGASAGRKFTQRFDSEGVRVYELEKPVSLADVLIESKFSYETIAGVGCFVRKPSEDDMEWGPVEQWITVVDRKYMIFATRRAILKEVLAGRGAGPEARAERLGWKSSDVSWGSPILILRKPEPDKTRTFPFERLLFTYETAKKKGRLDVISKDGAAVIKYARGLLGDRRSESRPVEDEEDEERWQGFGRVDPVGVHGDHHVFSVDVPKGEQNWFWNQTVHYLFNGVGSFF